jgi:tetratricopeptide (TPR) repeat protein
MNPDDAGARNNLGLTLLTTGHPGEALPLFEQRVVAEPDSPVGYMNLAHGLVLAGFRNEGIAAAERALLLDPYARPAQLMFVVRDMLHARSAAAEQRLERLLEVDRDCGRCLAYLGIISQLTDRLDEAERRYREAAATPGDNEVPFLRLAHLMAVRGRDAESRAFLSKATARAVADIKEEVDSAGPSWRLAAAAAIRGDRDEAVAWYARAVAAGRRDFAWDRFDPMFTALRRDAEFLELSDPRRLAPDHAAAEPVVRRLASTMHVVDRRFGRWLSAPSVTAPADPPGWPGVSK